MMFLVGILISLLSLRTLLLWRAGRLLPPG